MRSEYGVTYVPECTLASEILINFTVQRQNSLQLEQLRSRKRAQRYHSWP